MGRPAVCSTPCCGGVAWSVTATKAWQHRPVPPACQPEALQGRDRPLPAVAVGFPAEDPPQGSIAGRDHGDGSVSRSGSAVLAHRAIQEVSGAACQGYAPDSQAGDLEASWRAGRRFRRSHAAYLWHGVEPQGAWWEILARCWGRTGRTGCRMPGVIKCGLRVALLGRLAVSLPFQGGAMSGHTACTDSGDCRAERSRFTTTASISSAGMRPVVLVRPPYRASALGR